MRPLSILAFELPASIGPALRQESSLFALVLIDEERTPLPDVEALRGMFGMTRIEAEITQHICSGLPPSKIARTTRMSVHTVRGYLKAIFSKTEVNRQADLVRLVTWCCGVMHPQAPKRIAAPTDFASFPRMEDARRAVDGRASGGPTAA